MVDLGTVPMEEGSKLEKKTLERMSYEMTPQDQDGKRRNSLVYDLAYHHMSAWVHRPITSSGYGAELPGWT